MENEYKKIRKEKLENFISEGINPYPYDFNKKYSSKEALKLKIGAKGVTVAGRLVLIRDMGRLCFAHIQDESGKIQIALNEKEIGKEKYKFFVKNFDLGDFVGVSGEIFKTHKGEVTVLVKKYEMLSKAILPLPEKWHGIQDKEERYRKRYLDLIMNPEVKDVFDKREVIIDAIREFLKKKGFHETDTPYLQSVYGGANARPFKTHLNALEMDLFLAISPELYLKRLIVGGYEKVFTIARNFRNEGIDRWHNPEFTMMEIYQAYVDYKEMMDLFESIYEYAAKKANKSTKVEFRGKVIDFKKPWARMTMAEAIKKFAKIDVLKMSEKEILDYTLKNKIEVKDKTWGWAVQGIFEHFCEDKIEQPTFIIDHPYETTPLCKVHRKDSRLIERFEPFCMGAELGNAYSELNNPIIQKDLLEGQQKVLKKGDKEAHPYDEDFVNAIEVGLPPTGGLGMGIDRMIMLLTGQDSIRDVILFPFMKQKE